MIRSTLSHDFVTYSRSPEVSSTAFHAQPPDLPSAFDGYGLRDHLPARPALHASYPVLVHRLARLLHASFRPRLAATPLRFANPSPPSGWVEDFHLQAVEHARHTRLAQGERSPATHDLRGRAATEDAPWPSWPCSSTGKMPVAPREGPAPLARALAALRKSALPQPGLSDLCEMSSGPHKSRACNLSAIKSYSRNENCHPSQMRFSNERNVCRAGRRSHGAGCIRMLSVSIWRVTRPTR